MSVAGHPRRRWSCDLTWKVICAETRQRSEVTGVKLARNYGHQSASLAGLSQSDAEVVISINADLQDDLGAMAQMIERYREGAEIVFGVREKRSSDTLFKRATATAFYSSWLRWASGSCTIMPITA